MILLQQECNLRCGKSSLSLPIILAGKRQTLIASKKNAVEVPTLPLEMLTSDADYDSYNTWA